MNTVLFWLLIAIFILILCVLVFWVLRQIPEETKARHKANLAIRKAKWDEIERDLQSGNITQSQADAMKKEAERAYNRADRRGEDKSANSGPIWAVWVILSLCFAGSVWAYSQIGTPAAPDLPFALMEERRRPPQETFYALLEKEGALAPKAEIDQDTQALIAKLEAALEARPEEAEGWRLLARSSYSTGNFRRAYQAQQNYVDLIGNAAKSDDYSLLAESMILAVNGYISPQAEEALRQSLRLDATNRVSRYYAALTMIQQGDPEDGRKLLTQLLKESKDDPNWTSAINQRLSELETANGPSAEDISNAASLSDEERQQMIGNMVDGLKERLGREGGSPEEWTRLINALKVLGRMDEAQSILTEAKAKFPDDASIQALQ